MHNFLKSIRIIRNDYFPKSLKTAIYEGIILALNFTELDRVVETDYTVTEQLVYASDKIIQLTCTTLWRLGCCYLKKGGFI